MIAMFRYYYYDKVRCIESFNIFHNSEMNVPNYKCTRVGTTTVHKAVRSFNVDLAIYIKKKNK